MPEPMSGAVAHGTTLEELKLITRMALRYHDNEIARVLRKLGRRTGKRHRWTQTRVACARHEPGILTTALAKLGLPDGATRSLSDLG